MKTKTKIVSALSVMLAITAAAATTSTFAWFTTVRTATVNIAKTAAYMDNGNLAIRYDAVTNNGIDSGKVTESASNATAGITDTVDIADVSIASTDISGDGRTFFKPTWVPGADGVTAQSISSTGNTSGKTVLLQFGLTFTNSGTTNYVVCVNTGSIVAPNDSGIAADVAMAKASRVSIYSVATAGTLAASDALKTMWQYTSDTSAYQYLKTGTPASASEAAYSDETYATDKVVMASASSDFSSAWKVGAWNAVGAATPEVGQSLGTVAAGGSLSVVVSMWVEGTSSFATNTALGGSAKLTLKFAAK